MPPTPQRANRRCAGGPGGSQGFSSFGFFWGKPFFGPGSGGKGPAHTCPNPPGFIFPFLFAKPSIGEPFLPQNHLFPGPIFGQKRSPAQPAHPGDKFWIPGSKNPPRTQKYQICVPKNHAESSGQNSKRSHMLQVTAENHIGPSGVKHDGWREKPWVV